MDVGKQHISLTVIVPEPSSGTDAEDPPPDLLDIYYSKQACHHLSGSMSLGAKIPCRPLAHRNTLAGDPSFNRL